MDSPRKCKDCGKPLTMYGSDFCNDQCKLKHTLTLLRLGIDPDYGGVITERRKNEITAALVKRYGGIDFMQGK